MNKVLFVCIYMVVAIRVQAQTREMDSLKQVLSLTKVDTLRVDLLVRLGYLDQTFKGGLHYAEEGLALAKKINYKKGEGASLNQIGNQYWTISNYPVALNYYFQSLRIREAIEDSTGISRSYGNIGNVYTALEDLDRGLTYNLKALFVTPRNEIYNKALVMNDIGTIYEKRNQLDSALYHEQRSYEYFNQSPSKYQYSNTLNALGNLHAKLGNYDLAKNYLLLSIQNGAAYNDTLARSFSYLGLADLSKQLGNKDSCIAYAKKALFYAQRQSAQSVIVDAANLLSQQYAANNSKEAYVYLRMAMDARDSAFSREKTLQIQNMIFVEQERQNELNEQKAKEAADRKYNLQYAAISLGLVSFMILFLLFSHSVMADSKLIRFLGVLSLLIVFEFLNLLLHPYLEELTHHQPMVMLTVMVMIAALLIPLHHKLEHWVTYRLVEKNNKIRLAAAKKTIKQLEGKVGTNPGEKSTNAQHGI